MRKLRYNKGDTVTIGGRSAVIIDVDLTPGSSLPYRIQTGSNQNTKRNWISAGVIDGASADAQATTTPSDAGGSLW